jgi:ketosteroid isomerase-like protein
MQTNRIILIIALILILPFSGYAQSSNVYGIKNKSELFAVDSLFNIHCQSNGFSQAFIEFAAEDVILMRQNQFPIVGKDSLKKRYSAIKKQPNLSWSPVYADVAASGDLGYTFGKWKLVSEASSGADTVSYGVYISIWKRQSDGSWKYVFDGGNETPEQLPWDKK